MECTPGKFVKSTKLGRMVDAQDSCAVIQKNLHKQEKWTNMNLIKFNQGKCKVSYLGRNKPTQQYKLELSS